MPFKGYEWIPNFYIIFVAPPGVAGKSTTIRMGRTFLKGIKGVHFGPTVMTWQALPKILNTNIEMVNKDGRVEATAPTTFAASELGDLIDPKDKRMIDVLVDIWDSAEGVWEKFTKVSGDDRIYNPWINIIAGTTPAWLTENYPRQMIGGGFTSRCIFVYADKKQKLVAYPELDMGEDNESLKDSLRADLVEINKIEGQYTLSAEAKEWGTEWYESRLYNNPGHSSLGEDQYFGFLSRKQSHVHKLAMVMTAAQTNDLVIPLRNLKAAETLITALEKGLERIFSTIHIAKAQEGTSRLISIVRARKQILKAAAFRQLLPYMNIKEFNDALDSAATAGHIIMQAEAETGLVYLYAEEEKKE